MRLKNKKTGEIVESYLIETASAIGVGIVLQDNDTNKHYSYDSLAEFNKEWEDYEEPTSYWFIRDGGNVDYNPTNSSIAERHKEIGNYFETEEEAKRAVEKLKAWKRLRDAGFKITAWQHTLCADAKVLGIIHLEFPRVNENDADKNLDLLFSGGKK